MEHHISAHISCFGFTFFDLIIIVVREYNCVICVYCVCNMNFTTSYIMYIYRTSIIYILKEEWYLMLDRWMAIFLFFFVFLFFFFFFFYYFQACMHVTYVFRNTVVIIINFWWAFFMCHTLWKWEKNRSEHEQNV